MPYVIGISLLIITLVIIGLILRKKIYDHVDRLESWKIDIMNRDTAAQLAQVKKLNLSGETQEKFESWKDRWDAILTKDLTDVEEYLFDAEDAADRYRFSTAKKILHNAEDKLKEVEQDLERILQELHELLESEETSRQEIEALQPKVKELQNQLIKNGYQYGKARTVFDDKLTELNKQLNTYDELVESGDYLEAKELVDQLKVKIEELSQDITEFPDLYKTVKDHLPDQLDLLLRGIREMKEDGYRVEHLGFEKEIRGYEQRVKDCLAVLEKGTLSEVKTIVDDIKERIDDMYDLLEKEAIAKNYLEAKLPAYEMSLNELGTTFTETKSEVDLLRKTYYFEDADMEKYRTLEKSISALRDQLEEIREDMDDEKVGHTDIREKLESSFKQLENIEEQHEAFREQIYNLRKDELKAREELEHIKQQINDIKRKLKKSNLPGIPNFIWSYIDQVKEKNNQVMKALETQPLDMGEVQYALKEAKQAVDTAIEKTDLVLEQAYLTEQVIQYANRYRSSNPELAAKLVEAERLFRNYEYELALEHAAKAIEEVEPGALKRIESYQEAL